MIARVLPPEEWPRLAGTEAEHVWPVLNPENAEIRVVEEDGEIVGVWCGLRMMHAECFWIAPKYRGSYRVIKGLWNGLCETAKRWGVSRMETASMDPHVSDMIQRWGGERVTWEAFIVPIAREKRKVA
jgi:hypothetical protein